MNNLGFVQGGWFQTYKGRIYGNKPTDIHNRITNKGIIETMIVKPWAHGDDFKKVLEAAKPRKAHK